MTARLRLSLRYQSFLNLAHWQRLSEAARANSPRKRSAGRQWQSGYRHLERAAVSRNPRYLNWAKAEFVSAALSDPGMCDAYLALYLIEDAGSDKELALIEAIGATGRRIGEEQQQAGCTLDVRYAPLGFVPASVRTADDACLFTASELIKRNQLDAASFWLERVERQTAAALAVRAKLALLAADYPLALSLLTPVISNSAQLRADALWARGVAQARQGECDEAIVSLLQAVECAEQKDMRLYARYTLANVYEAVGDDDARARELRAIYQEDPGFENVAAELSLAWADDPQQSSGAGADDPSWLSLVASFQSGTTAADPYDSSDDSGR